MVVIRTWYLELNGVPLATPAWEIPDLSAVFDSPALLGSNRRVIDGVHGYPRVTTETIKTFPLNVFGDFDSDGDPITDVFEGLTLNKEFLDANLGLAESVGEGTVPAIYHRGNLAPKVADVQFLGFKGSRTEGVDNDIHIKTTFDILILDGDFEEESSS